MTSTKRPGVGEFGEAAKEGQAPKIKFPEVKAIPDSIAREENLEKLFMRSDQWPQFDSLAPEATIHRASSKARGGNRHNMIKSGLRPHANTALIVIKEQILDRFGCKRNKIIDCCAVTALRFRVTKFAHLLSPRELNRRRGEIAMTQNAQLSGVTCFRKFFHAIALLAVVVFGALPMLAQFDTGTITGTVTDASGAVVSRAAITVTNVGTGIQKSFVTDQNGNFVASSLPFGTYVVRSRRQRIRGNQECTDRAQRWRDGAT